jgi:hypothetical protein
MRRLSTLVAAGALALAAVPSVASADLIDPNGPIQSCFGIASGQRASTLHDTGQHASSFEEPRLGIGNIAFRDALGLGLFFDSVGEVGSLLASIDEIEATHCP